LGSPKAAICQRDRLHVACNGFEAEPIEKHNPSPVKPSTLRFRPPEENTIAPLKRNSSEAGLQNAHNIAVNLLELVEEGSISPRDLTFGDMLAKGRSSIATLAETDLSLKNQLGAGSTVMLEAAAIKGDTTGTTAVRGFDRKVVPRAGLEPATPALRMRCSTS
jgi:hypothetical protein